MNWETKLQQKIKWSPHKGQQRVLDSESRDIVMCCGRRWGKSAIVAYEAVRDVVKNIADIKAGKTDKPINIWIVAPSYNLAERVFEYFHRWMMRAMPSQAKNFKNRPYPMLKTKIDIGGQIFAGPKVECKSTENPQGLLGEEVDLLIVDEAAQLSQSIYDEYLYATTTSRQGKTIFISTPRAKNWFYRRWIDAKEGAFHFTSKDNPYFPEEEWERAKKILPEQVFNQEFRAQFLDDAAGVFRRVRDIVDPDLNPGLPPDPNHTYLVGADLGKKHDFTVVYAIDNMTNQVVYRDRFNKVDYNIQKERIKAATKKYNNALCTIDTTGGVADSIKDDLLRDGVSVDDFIFTGGKYGKSKKELVEKLMVAIEQQYISIPEDSQLIDELEYFSYEITPSGNVQYRAPEGENFYDDCVMALALAVWNLNLERQPAITPIQEEIAKNNKKPRTTFI